MWFWLISAIAGSIIGSATDSWFRDTKMGVWFYAKIDQLYTWACMRYGITSEGIVGKKPVMNGWGRVHVLEQRSDPDRPNVFKEVVSQLPELPEDRSWNWQYFLDNTVPFHKDPSSHCWLGIMVLGDQDIEFAVDEEPKQKDGIYIGRINYKVALINSKELHAPVSDGNSRCILRYVFTETSYNDVKNILKEHFKCGSG